MTLTDTRPVGGDALTAERWAAVPKAHPRRWHVERDVTGYAVAARCPACGRTWQGPDAAVAAKAHTRSRGHQTVAVARIVTCWYSATRPADDLDAVEFGDDVETPHEMAAADLMPEPSETAEPEPEPQPQPLVMPEWTPTE